MYALKAQKLSVRVYSIFYTILPTTCEGKEWHSNSII